MQLKQRKDPSDVNVEQLSLRETEKDFKPFGIFGCCTKATQVYLKKIHFAVSFMQIHWTFLCLFYVSFCFV